MRKLLAISTVLVLSLSAPVAAQDNTQTLADIRQELTILYGQIRALGQELNTTGAPSGTAGGTALDRLNAIESELQRLTAHTEEMQFRIDRIVRDGTNQIGDLEFRLCELEPGCDIGTLGDTPTLGGDITGSAGFDDYTRPVVEDPGAAPDDGPELAISEEADFDRAREALASGDFTSAAQQFAAFGTAYPGSPLGPDAEFGRGEALENMGDIREAARAFLNAFSLAPTGQTAPNALYRLGNALGRLGQTNEACLTLAEVEIRFPSDPAVDQARGQMVNIGCS